MESCTLGDGSQPEDFDQVECSKQARATYDSMLEDCHAYGEDCWKRNSLGDGSNIQMTSGAAPYCRWSSQ